MEPIALEPVDALTITTLVDNVTDSLLADQGPAKRPSMTKSPRMPAQFTVGGDTDDALRAEHGFSALVMVTRGERTTRLLFDAGRTPDGLVENMRRLQISPGEIDIIVLSHGHWDHVTGMDGLTKALGRPSMPVLFESLPLRSGGRGRRSAVGTHAWRCAPSAPRRAVAGDRRRRSGSAPTRGR
jgi:7,8-dihydropterin-6-yl-methyl-4-(beta-D-ribofuranosyl)aminobenzene 5'-phosphate synthase